MSFRRWGEGLGNGHSAGSSDPMGDPDKVCDPRPLGDPATRRIHEGNSDRVCDPRQRDIPATRRIRTGKYSPMGNVNPLENSATMGNSYPPSSPDTAGMQRCIGPDGFAATQSLAKNYGRSSIQAGGAVLQPRATGSVGHVQGDGTREGLLFVRHGKTLAVVYAFVIISTYLLAIICYPLLHIATVNPMLYYQNFGVFLTFSIPISLALLLVKSSYIAGILLLMRCYLIMILGYGLHGSYLMSFLLGIGFLMESGALLDKPYNGIISLVGILGMVSVQGYLPFWGANTYYGGGQIASYAERMVFGFVLLSVALVIITMVNQVAHKKRMQEYVRLQEVAMETLAEFNVDLQRYAQNIDIESSDRERNRISREIHDISGYIFTNLIALLNAACSIPQEDRESLSDILLTARKQAQEGLKETRIALRKTRELPIPQEVGVRAIYKIISIFQQTTGLHVDVHWGNIPHSFSRAINFAIYRTVQEALTNTIRHSLATKVSIYFSVKNDILHMSIIDNGQGAETVEKGIGLKGMDERIGNLYGHVYTKNAPGGGFQLDVIIPLPKEALS